jgi:CBS domain-containing protein
MTEAPSALQQQAAHQAISEAVRELSLVSDEARFQIHLFSLEAKRRWNEIEGKLRQLEARIADGVDSGASPELSAIRELIERGQVSAPTTPVRRLMRSAVRSCRPDQPLSDAAAQLVESNTSVLPIVDDTGVLIGILSERDICLGAYASGAALADTPVATAMRREASSANAEASLGDVAELMRQHKLDEIPVTSDDGRVVGMLCLRDLARALSSDVDAHVDPVWLAATVVDVYAR